MSLKLVTTTDSECSGEGGVCSSRPVVASIVQFLKRRGLKVQGGPEKAVEAAKATLNCQGEACILDHPEFVGGLTPDARLTVKQDLALRFKPVGPRDTTALLSNYDIDGTLQQWALKFPQFYCCPFAMADFETAGGGLAQVSLPDVYRGSEPLQLGGRRIRRPCRTFACVLNTDVSSGPGQHWVAVFVDMRGEPDLRSDNRRSEGASNSRQPWSVEYFNSAGNPPFQSVARWMESTARALREAFPAREVQTVPVTRVVHQHSRTECGPYSLFYIRARLDGVPYEQFRRDKVTDAEMTQFRSHLFRRAE